MAEETLESSANLPTAVESLSLQDSDAQASTSNGLAPPSLATWKSLSTNDVPQLSDIPVLNDIPAPVEPEASTSSPLKTRDFAVPSPTPAASTPPPTASAQAAAPNGTSSSSPPPAVRQSSAPADVPSLVTTQPEPAAKQLPPPANAMPRGLGGLRGRGGAAGSARNIPVPPSLQAKVAAVSRMNDFRFVSECLAPFIAGEPFSTTSEYFRFNTQHSYFFSSLIIKSHGFFRPNRRITIPSTYFFILESPTAATTDACFRSAWRCRRDNGKT